MGCTSLFLNQEYSKIIQDDFFSFFVPSGPTKGRSKFFFLSWMFFFCVLFFTGKRKELFIVVSHDIIVEASFFCSMTMTKKYFKKTFQNLHLNVNRRMIISNKKNQFNDFQRNSFVCGEMHHKRNFFLTCEYVKIT